jgi:tetratricopeptide (TPR) repeat protein
VLEKLAEAKPKNPLYPYWQGRLDYDQQKLSDAAAKFEKAIALDSGFVKAYDSLGLCLEDMGKYNEAIQQYQRAVQLNRDSKVHSAWPPLNLGILLVKSNQRTSRRRRNSFSGNRCNWTRILPRLTTSSEFCVNSTIKRMRRWKS